MKLDYPPPNEFMPKAENIISKKVDRLENVASKPVLLDSENPHVKVWYK